MDPEMIKQGISTYIEEKWINGFYGMNINISVEDKGNNYTAICTFYKEGYGGDIRGRTLITFRDVRDATDEFVDDGDDDLWCSAYVDVTCKIDTINTAHTEDLHEFAKFAESMYEFLNNIYYSLPSESERHYFYVR